MSLALGCQTKYLVSVGEETWSSIPRRGRGREGGGAASFAAEKTHNLLTPHVKPPGAYSSRLPPVSFILFFLLRRNRWHSMTNWFEQARS